MILSKPTQLNEFIINKHLSDILSLFNINNMQNIILFGEKNTGKKTLVHAFINHLFSISTDLIHIQNITKTYKYRKHSYTCAFKQCNYYYEIDCLENIKMIKHIINHFISELCSNQTLHNKYRIIIIHNIDSIHHDNLKSLSNIIEKYYKCNKFIILSNNNKKHIYNSKIFNLCVPIRSYINKNEIEQYITHTNKKFTKKIKKKMIQCTDLFELQMLMEYKSLPLYNPIEIFLDKIYTLLKKSEDILFIPTLKTFIYDIYLLNFNIQKLPIQYIKYILEKKEISNDNLHILYHLANKYNSVYTFEAFSFIENFFIEVKYKNLL